MGEQYIKDVDYSLVKGEKSGLDHLAEAIHFSSYPAFVLDGHHRLVSWNQAAEVLLGYQAKEVLGSPCYTVLRFFLSGGIPLCTPRCEIYNCFLQGQSLQLPHCLARCRDGQWLPLSLSTLPWRSVKGDEMAVVVFLYSQKNPSSPLLRIFTLGSFKLMVGGRELPIAQWPRKQALTILKYLVTFRGRSVHREQLMECLWPEVPEDQAWGRLKVCLSFLRQQLRQALQQDPIFTLQKSYMLRLDGIWLDVQLFEELIQQGRRWEEQGKEEEAINCYQEAESLYRGDYLEEDLYADWCAEEREHLRHLYLDMMERLARLYAHLRDYDRAIQICRKALVREKSRESLHCLIMEYLWRQGRQDEALSQYHACAQALRHDLDIEPSPATQSLYSRILRSP